MEIYNFYHEDELSTLLRLFIVHSNGTNWGQFPFGSTAKGQEISKAKYFFVLKSSKKLRENFCTNMPVQKFAIVSFLFWGKIENIDNWLLKFPDL